MNLKHGCRSEYGPLKLWIQTMGLKDEFLVHVEDPRLHRTVLKEKAEGTLVQAQGLAARYAGAYLIKLGEESQFGTDWKCS